MSGEFLLVPEGHRAAVDSGRASDSACTALVARGAGRGILASRARHEADGVVGEATSGDANSGQLLAEC